MPLYTLIELPIPPGFVHATPNKINSNGVIAGTCGEYYGRTSAMIWDTTGYKVIGPPAFYGRSTSINANDILVGSFTDAQIINCPFFWDNKTSTFALINQPPNYNEGLIVSDINDKNQMIGHTEQYSINPFHSCLFWSGLNSIPVGFGNPTKYSWSAGINNNGILIGAINNNGSIDQAFFGDTATQALTLIPNSTSCWAINDLTKPQILSFWNYSPTKSYMFDTSTNVLNDLTIPGVGTFPHDINNNSEIVGETSIDGAVLWKGLIKIKLNNPLISDAQIKGWNLTSASSINDMGQIVGLGFFNGKQLPWLLNPNPKLTARKIPFEHMLPQILWPGQAYDRPKPKRWPKAFPFPLPDPSPFGFVGEAYRIQQEILNVLKIQEMVNNIPDKREGVAIGKIVTKLIQQKSKKLSSLIEKGLLERSKSKK